MRCINIFFEKKNYVFFSFNIRLHYVLLENKRGWMIDEFSIHFCLFIFHQN